MPGRPPREWFRRCVEDVAAGGAALDPGAVCGATWARKTPAEKRATVAFEEGTTMATKKKAKKKKKGGKLHGAALTAWRKAHGVTPGVTRRRPRRRPPRARRRHGAARAPSAATTITTTERLDACTTSRTVASARAGITRNRRESQP